MSKLFGDYTTVNTDRIQSIVSKVNDMTLSCRNITSSKKMTSIVIDGKLDHKTEEEVFFINKTNEFRRRLRSGETIDDIMVEALAVVREAIRRRLGMFPYDTQIEAAVSMIGASIDENNRERIIAEMKTGEGKTLVQMLVAYINALEATKDEDKSKWTSIHIITSNDALAKRDQRSNSAVFKLLGFSCGFVPDRNSVKNASPAERNINNQNKKKAYNSDIVYATASTVGFDYLEDNTIYNVTQRIMARHPGFAIIDEADDILIDQAINPLKLSSPPNPNGSFYDKELIKRESETKALYKWATELLYGKSNNKPLTSKVYNQEYESKGLRPEDEGVDYIYYKDTKNVVFNNRVRKLLKEGLGNSVEDNNTFSIRYFALIKCITAKESFHNGKEYTVETNGNSGRIVIIDQNIGRKKQSNKYTDGIQEAIEAKEEFLEQEAPSSKKRYHIVFSHSSSIRAMFTYPDYLTIYSNHVCGMTGTSDEEEFKSLYGFDTYRVPTRKRNIRIDTEPELYATLIEKYNAIVEEVKRCVSIGQPVLIGTTSLNESKIVSSFLAKNYIRHQLLNANNEEEESQIIKGAGQFGVVTVATNMAGRGTDIKLGPGVRELGGLFVIGTSRNKSSRIDRQLMGRSGRQGDPGKTKYFSSLEDELVLECYRGAALDGLIARYRDTNQPIKNKKLIESIEQSQILRESKDKKTRQDTEKFNKAFMEHRKIIYENRNQVLDSTLLEFMTMIKKIITKYVDILIKDYSDEDIERLIGHLIPVKSLYDSNRTQYRQNIIYALYNKYKSNFEIKNVKNSDIQSYVSNIKIKFLNIIDMYWLSHIDDLEDLKLTINLGSSEDPFKEFDKASVDRFAKYVIPSMYNEMITYALNPSLELGSYTIKRTTTEEREEKHLL